MPVVGLMPDNNLVNQVLSNLSEVKARHGLVYIFTNKKMKLSPENRTQALRDKEMLIKRNLRLVIGVAKKYRNKITVSHSQRSVARISIKFENTVWIEDLQEICINALKTETQVVVKREDEMAFAELNGSHLKFVEDAARLLYEQLIAEKRIKDFRVICSHQESLHSHDAISVLLAPNSNFCADVSHETWSSLIHIS